MYIIYALIGFIVLGLISVLDKFILTKKVASSAIYTFEVSIFSLLLFFLLPSISIWPTDLMTWFLVFVDGLFFFLGLLFMFRGVKESEVSHVGPLIGAAVPFFTIFLSRFFLQEVLTDRQLVSIGFLIVGSLLISFEKSKEHNGIHRGMLWGLLSGLFFAGSHVASKYLYQVLGFYGGTILIRSAIGICGIALLFLPSVRHNIFNKKKVGEKKGSGSFILVAFNTALGVVATLLTQYAISIGSVSVVNSLEGVRYAVLIIMVAILSRFYSKFFKEEYTRWEILQEILSIGLIGVGLWLLI